MYDVYIGGVLLPVTPEKITTEIRGRNETFTLIDDSEVSSLRSPGLTTVSLTALLPNVRYPFARYASGAFEPAKGYLDALEAMAAGKKAVQFIVSRRMPTGRALFHTNMAVTVEGYTIIDSAQNGFDTEVRIELRQYRPYSTKVFELEAPSEGAPVRLLEERPESTVPATKKKKRKKKKKNTGGTAKKKAVARVGTGGTAAMVMRMH